MCSGVDNPATDRLIAARKSTVKGALSLQLKCNTLLDQPNDLLYVDESPS